MSIRPIDFNGMLQNTHELSQTRIHENEKPIMQQAQLTVQVDKEEQQRRHQVNDKDDANGREYRYDREGDGRGYNGNGSKKHSSDKQNKEKRDGSVYIKNGTSSFDIKI